MQDDRLKRVLVIKTGDVYDTVERASNALSIPSYIMLRHIRSGTPFVDLTGQKLYAEFTTKKSNTNPPMIGRIRIVESGRIYKDLHETYEQTGINENSIQRLIISGREGRTVYGKRIHLELLTD